VDNNSSDGSLDYLRRAHPEIRLFPITQNLGYSGAYNSVIPSINGDILVLLNFDVEVDPDWLGDAIEVLERSPNVAAVQPKLKSLQNKAFLEYAGGCGGFIDRYGYPFVRGRLFDTLEEDNGQYDDSVPIHWASGAALITRRSSYLEVSGLDNDFFLHMEELDLCWRYWLHGWEVKVAPRGVVYHHSGAALSADRYRKMYYNHRNGLVMLLKNYSVISLFKYLPIRIFLDWLTVLMSPFQGQYKRSFAVIAAHLFVLIHLPGIWRKHVRVQRLRRISDNDLASVIFPGSIVYRYYLLKQKTYSQLLAGR
jgi:GT2 family glycosyltransferase